MLSVYLPYGQYSKRFKYLGIYGLHCKVGDRLTQLEGTDYDEAMGHFDSSFQKMRKNEMMTIS